MSNVGQRPKKRTRIIGTQTLKRRCDHRHTFFGQDTDSHRAREWHHIIAVVHQTDHLCLHGRTRSTERRWYDSNRQRKPSHTLEKTDTKTANPFRFSTPPNVLSKTIRNVYLSVVFYINETIANNKTCLGWRMRCGQTLEVRFRNAVRNIIYIWTSVADCWSRINIKPLPVYEFALDGRSRIHSVWMYR